MKQTHVTWHDIRIELETHTHLMPNESDYRSHTLRERARERESAYAFHHRKPCEPVSLCRKAGKSEPVQMPVYRNRNRNLKTKMNRARGSSRLSSPSLPKHHRSQNAPPFCQKNKYTIKIWNFKKNNNRVGEWISLSVVFIYRHSPNLRFGIPILVIRGSWRR